MAEKTPLERRLKARARELGYAPTADQLRLIWDRVDAVHTSKWRPRSEGASTARQRKEIKEEMNMDMKGVIDDAIRFVMEGHIGGDIKAISWG